MMRTKSDEPPAPDEAPRFAWWIAGWRAIDWSTICTVLAIKALIFVFAILSVRNLRRPAGWAQMWNRWDAEHYLAIAEHGYTGIGARSVELAFFPLYPGLVGIVGFLTNNYLTAALI